jgi:hypothetical protein
MNTQSGSIRATALSMVAFVGLYLANSNVQAAQDAGSDRSSFLAHSDVMSSGPGSPVSPKQKIVVCYKGKETKEIDYKKFLKYPDKYTAGPCPTWTLVCENNKNVKWIKPKYLAKYLDKNNVTLGNCTGVGPNDERVICWKGWTIETKVKDLVKYPGYVNNPCS